jgi:predicted nucleotidyltransferase
MFCCLSPKILFVHFPEQGLESKIYGNNVALAHCNVKKGYPICHKRRSKLMKKIILDTIQTNIECELIYIFGSYNTARFNAESDIDIAMYPKNDLTDEDISKLKWELIQNTGRGIDLINLKEAQPVLAKEIVSKGEIIYYNNEKFKSEFIYNVMAKYAQYVDDINVIINKVKERGSVL